VTPVRCVGPCHRTPGWSRKCGGTIDWRQPICPTLKRGATETSCFLRPGSAACRAARARCQDPRCNHSPQPSMFDVPVDAMPDPTRGGSAAVGFMRKMFPDAAPLPRRGPGACCTPAKLLQDRLFGMARNSRGWRMRAALATPSACRADGREPVCQVTPGTRTEYGTVTGILDKSFPSRRGRLRRSLPRSRTRRRRVFDRASRGMLGLLSYSGDRGDASSGVPNSNSHRRPERAFPPAPRAGAVQRLREAVGDKYFSRSDNEPGCAPRPMLFAVVSNRMTSTSETWCRASVSPIFRLTFRSG